MLLHAVTTRQVAAPGSRYCIAFYTGGKRTCPHWCILPCVMTNMHDRAWITGYSSNALADMN
eukprot:1161347-Pelagomonas_calceolata.AAC.4